MQNRFDPHEENCIFLAIDRITHFFDLPLASIPSIEKIKTVKDIVSYFKERKLDIEGYYHTIFLVNPRYWRLIIQEKFHNIRFCNNVCHDRCAYLYFTSGNELYGVREFWNHVVVELFDKERIYYDDYLPIVKQEHPNLTIIEPSHEKLQSEIASFCLIIRSEKG